MKDDAREETDGEETGQPDEIAEDLYEVDRVGIAVNGFIAALASAANSLMLKVASGASNTTALMAFGIGTTLFAGVKVGAEYAKARAVREGQVTAFRQGYNRGETSYMEILFAWKAMFAFVVLDSSCYVHSEEGSYIQPDLFR